MNNESNFWIGIEVEGRYKGIRTLFVVGDQPIIKIQKYLFDNDICHIYFGAGNQSVVNDFNIIRFFIRKEKYNITYEIEEKNINKIPKDIIENKMVHIIVTYKSNKLQSLKPTDTIKIEDDNMVYCSSICNMFQTNKDSDYNNDELL